MFYNLARPKRDKLWVREREVKGTEGGKAWRPRISEGQVGSPVAGSERKTRELSGNAVRER